MNRYIDSHTHLQSYTTKHLLVPDVNNMTWEKAWENAQKNNVKKILNIFDISHDEEMLIMHEMEKKPDIYLAAAVHPCNVHLINLTDARNKLLNIIDKIHCIGETGIDIFNNKTHISTQIEFFKMHIEIANIYNKPLSIHYRNNNENNHEFIHILQNLLSEYSHITFVMHCCTFDYNTIKPLLNFPNCFISISGIVTYKNSINIHNLAMYVPINRLLIETDSPFLTPDMPNVNRYKTNNESANVQYIYKKIAELRNIDISILQTQIYNNFMKFLKK